MEKMERQAKKKQLRKTLRSKEQEISVEKVYLAIYNAIQFGGWAYIFFLLIGQWLEYLPNWREASAGAYEVVHLPLTIFQVLAIAEVINSIIGLVRASWFTTAVQVASRVFLVAVSFFVPAGRESVFFSLMVFCWSITEIIRYLYFTLLNPLVVGKTVPDSLTFLRYSTFLILYPAGVLGEVGVIYSSLSAVPATVSYFLMAVMVVYLPGLPYMYSHMMRQRRKALAGGDKSD